MSEQVLRRHHCRRNPQNREGSLDDFLVAISATNGNVIWQTAMINPSEDFTMTGPPLIAKRVGRRKALLVATEPSYWSRRSNEAFISQPWAAKMALLPRDECGRLVLYSIRLLDHDLHLVQQVENFSVQAFVPQLPIETLAVTVLLWTPRLDVERSRAQSRQPLSRLLRREFRDIVRTNAFRDSPEHLKPRHGDNKLPLRGSKVGLPFSPGAGLKPPVGPAAP